AFESELLLPSSLANALIRAEEQVAPEVSTATYQPQDHFVHLVHLYLLGIYLFTYHKKLHRCVTRFFEGLRHTTNAKLHTQSDEAAFLDFLFAWRAFVLLHDLGYVWELPPLQDETTVEATREIWNYIPELMA